MSCGLLSRFGLVEEPVLRKQFAIKYTQMVALLNPDKLFNIANKLGYFRVKTLKSS